MAVGDAHVFPGFLTSVLTQLFFPKPPTTFLTCFCRGERRQYAGKKVLLNRGSNSQPPGHESAKLTNERFLLFPQCFLPYQRRKSSLELCRLQMLSIWSSPKFCRLVVLNTQKWPKTNAGTKICLNIYHTIYRYSLSPDNAAFWRTKDIYL